jgi:hypothetical protein
MIIKVYMNKLESTKSRIYFSQKKASDESNSKTQN